MTGLDQIRSVMVETLCTGGISAVSAWPYKGFQGLSEGMVAVSIRSCEDGQAGFGHYLGERYDSDTDKWSELYGKKIQVEFGLDIYTPTKIGAQESQEIFDQLNAVFHQYAPTGLKMEKLSRGEIKLNNTLGVFCCPVVAQCSAFLYAIAEDGGEFVDFEVKGEKK